MRFPALSKPVKRGLLALPVLLALAAGVALNVQAENKAIAEHAHHHAAAAPAPAANAPMTSLKGRGEIAAARWATARFLNVETAKSSGYPNDVSGCVESPDGGMGHHYLNPGLVGDGGALDVRKPEALVYEPQQNGSLRLVALEYIVSGNDVPASGPAPTLYGRQFEHSSTTNNWTLHAWVWRDNPSGMFAPYNPRVSCQFAG